MYSDSNWNSSEGGDGGSSSRNDKSAAEMAWRAVIVGVGVVTVAS